MIGSALFEFFGRLHPMLLHLPIGLMVGLALLEATDMLGRRSDSQPAQTWLTRLLALTAVASAATGFALSYEPSYQPDAIRTHMWLGFAGTAAALGLLPAERARARGSVRGRLAFRLILALCLLLVGIAGHLGAEITHGRNFLWKPFASASAPSTTDSATADRTGFARAAAVLDRYCISCHGAEKDKGGLRLDSHDAVIEGSTAGPVVTAGNAEESLLVQRMRLPIDHDDRMPPAKQVQPEEADIQAIEAWIRAGAKKE